MSEESEAERSERLLDADGAGTTGNHALGAELARQRRVHQLLIAQLDQGDAERTFAAIRSVSSSSRRERIAAGIAQRVGRSMARRPASRRRPSRISLGRWLIAATLAIAVVGIWGWLQTPARNPVTTAVAMRLETIAIGTELRRDDRVVDPVAGMVLQPGDALTVANDGGEIAYADGSRVRLAAGTRLSLGQEATGKRLWLNAGAVTGTIMHQDPTAPLIVEGRYARAEVVGTIFSLAETALGTQLQVDQGQVRLAGTSTAVLVAAGSQAIATRDQAPTPYEALETKRLVVRASDECDEYSQFDKWDMTSGGLVDRIIAKDDPASGSTFLRLDFRFISQQRSDWGSRGRTLPLQANDRAIRFRLRVERADPGAEFFLHARENDGDVWVLAHWPVAAGGGWRTVEVPIPPANRPPLAHATGAGGWQVDQVRFIMFGAKRAALTAGVDLVEVLADP